MTHNDPNRDKFEEERMARANQSNDSMGGIIAVAVLIIVLVAGGILFFTGSSGTGPNEPQVTQNNTTLPAPTTEPAQPEPIAPSTEPTTPPAAPAPSNNP